MAPDAGPAPDDLREFLRHVPLLAELSDDVLADVARQSKVVSLHAGDWLFRQGDPGDSLYVVRSGRLDILREEGDGASNVGTLARGAAVGELALLLQSARSASVRAVRDSELLRLDAKHFTALLNRTPAFALALTRMLGRHLQARGGLPSQARSTVSVLTVLPQQPDLPYLKFVEPFEQALGQWARVGRLTRPTVPPGRSAASAGEAAETYGRLLDDHERTHDQTILIARPEDDDPSWMAFCLRQADRVVVLTRAAVPPPPDLRLPDGCDLVLWGASAPAAQREPWLRALRPRAHHLVKPGADAAGTAARVARRIMGRSLGIVLSGGGARGLAHIGVLAALEDAGVVVDRVGGCSMGAFVGALWAGGLRGDALLARCREEIVTRRPFNDYTVPRVALIRGQKARAMFTRVFGDSRIEELRLDFFCVSCDLRTAELVVHRQGRIRDAVGFSMALPGLAPPVLSGGRLLVDGGVVDNMPVRTMVETGEGPVIAVDVVGRRYRPAPGPPYSGGLPGIGETLSRAMLLGSSQTAELSRAAARLVIAPDLADVGLLAFQQIDRLVASGRRGTELALTQAPELGVDVRRSES